MGWWTKNDFKTYKKLGYGVGEIMLIKGIYEQVYSEFATGEDWDVEK